MTNTPPVTHCREGHEYTPENTRYRSDGRRMCVACGEYCRHGHKYTLENTGISNGKRFCKECSRIKQRKRRRGRVCVHGITSPQTNCIECRYAVSVSNSLRNGTTPKDFEEFLGTKNPLDYLSLSPEQAQAGRDFDFAVDTTGRPLCEVPEKREVRGKVIDYYPHADFDSERPPTIVEAAKMCIGCPLLEECAKLGASLNSGRMKMDGVYGGRVYVGGKLVNK